MGRRDTGLQPQWCVLYISTSKCASRHNGVQILISHLPSGLRTRCFSEPTFSTLRSAKTLENTVFRDFSTFSRTCIFFLLTPFFLLFSFFFVLCSFFFVLCFLFFLLSSLFFFFLFLFSCFLFCSLLMSSLTLPTSAFPFVHIVGSLTSKLPSMMSRYCIVDIVRCLGSALVVEVMYRCCKVTLRPCYVDVM